MKAAVPLFAALSLVASIPGYAASPASERVSYQCENRTKMTVVYSGHTATIQNGDGHGKIVLARHRSAKGQTYETSSKMIHREGDTIIYQMGKLPGTTCRPVS